MRLWEQNIPDWMRPMYERLFEFGWNNFKGETHARTKPKVHKPKRLMYKRRILRDYERAIDYLGNYLAEKNGYAMPKSWYLAQLQDMKKGIFSPEYWIAIEGNITGVFHTFPSFGPFTNVRNYAYPDGVNIPSKPVYLDGLPSLGLPTYEGSTKGLIYSDDYLSWQRWEFVLDHKIVYNDDDPVFLKLDGQITAQADKRGSRAMLSVIIQRWFCNETDPQRYTIENPTHRPLSAYWRYRIPKQFPPYFQSSHTLQLLYKMRSNRHEAKGYNSPLMILLLAPMPMMGHRYNNNTHVKTELDVTPTLYQIKKGGKMFAPRKPLGIELFTWSSPYGITFAAGAKIYKNNETTGESPEIDLPWTVNDDVRMIFANGGSWWFWVRYNHNNSTEAMYELKADNTFAAPTGRVYEGYYQCSTFWSKAVLMGDSGVGFYWLDENNNLSAQSEGLSGMVDAEPSSTGVSLMIDHGDGPIPIFIPWTTPASAITWGMDEFIVPSFIPREPWPETLFSNDVSFP